MNRTMRSLLLGVTSGMLEYLISLSFSLIPYWDHSSFMFRMMIGAALVIGCAIAAAALLFKNKSVAQAALRWLYMFFAFLVSVLISAYIGTIQFLRGVLGINIHAATENVCGMLLLGFFLAIQAVCLTTVVGTAIVKTLKRLAMKKAE